MIIANNISKSYNSIKLINDFNIEINKGEFVAITGESGKGKTTILNILGLLEKFDSGELIFEGRSKLRSKDIMLIQRRKIAYLFQNYALIENETIEYNLKIALKYRKNCNKSYLIKESLKFVNLSTDILKKKVYQMSGGEQQRVAIARLWLKEADYVFADEPTGNLDKKNRNIIFELLLKLNSNGKTVIMVTHDEELANKASRRINLK